MANTPQNPESADFSASGPKFCRTDLVRAHNTMKHRNRSAASIGPRANDLIKNQNNSLSSVLTITHNAAFYKRKWKRPDFSSLFPQNH
jgi:hypothetical protein